VRKKDYQLEEVPERKRFPMRNNKVEYIKILKGEF
jgi:hypothetical protein